MLTRLVELRNLTKKYKAKQSAKPAAETKPVQEEPAKPASAEEVAPEVNDTPAVEKAKEETPKAEDVKAEAPAEEAKEEAPAAEEVKEETPKAEEVKAEAPSEEESKEEAPAEEEDKEETPKAEEVKAEEPPAEERQKKRQRKKEETPKDENKEEEGDKEKEKLVSNYTKHKSLQILEDFFFILVSTQQNMKFADIPGLEEEKKRLIDFFKRDKIHHALLFFGLEGSANLPLALSFATYINCENKKENDSCGECPSCLKMNKINSSRRPSYISSGPIT